MLFATAWNVCVRRILEDAITETGSERNCNLGCEFSIWRDYHCARSVGARSVIIPEFFFPQLVDDWEEIC